MSVSQGVTVTVVVVVAVVMTIVVIVVVVVVLVILPFSFIVRLCLFRGWYRVRDQIPRSLTLLLNYASNVVAAPSAYVFRWYFVVPVVVPVVVPIVVAAAILLSTVVLIFIGQYIGTLGIASAGRPPTLCFRRGSHH